MKIEIINGQRVESADEGKWLYKDEQEERLFRDVVYLGKDTEPWPECTDEEKQQWEEEHPQPSPEPGPAPDPSEEEAQS